MNKLGKVLKRIDAISEWSAKAFSFLIILVTAIEVREVIARYVFNRPTIWTWEVSSLLCGMLWIMGAAWVLKEGRHVRTDVFYRRFSPKSQTCVDLVLFPCLLFVFVGVMIWHGIPAAVHSCQIREGTWSIWSPPLYPTKVVMVLAFLLLGLQGLAKWIRDLVFVIKGINI